jgi:hypothetical protein
VGSIDAEGFLPKPFELDDLLSQVKRWAESAPANGAMGREVSDPNA